MAMTDEEKQQIKQEVLAEIESSSIGVTELEEVSSLSGVNSLPAMSGAKVVRVPISLLSKPAEDAAASVNKLIEQADSKFKELDSLTDSTKSAAESASKAAATAEAVTKTVTEALNSLNGVAGELRGTVVNVNRVLNTTSSYEDVVAAANALVAAGITAAQQDGVVLISERRRAGRVSSSPETRPPNSRRPPIGGALEAVPEVAAGFTTSRLSSLWPRGSTRLRQRLQPWQTRRLKTTASEA